MNDFLPEAVLTGLREARAAALRRSSRLCIHDGERVHRILRLWDGGFSITAADAPRLRGRVDLYDGSRHVSQCLVMQSREYDGERIYEFKWHTAVSDHPPVDFAREIAQPAGLLSRLF